MDKYNVAPFAGAWIEIDFKIAWEDRNKVAPFAGAWIEISRSSSVATAFLSLPSRERGLKSQKGHSFIVIGNPLKLSPDFPPLHTGRATFTASGVPSVVFTSI